MNAPISMTEQWIYTGEYDDLDLASEASDCEDDLPADIRPTDEMMTRFLANCEDMGIVARVPSTKKH